MRTKSKYQYQEKRNTIATVVVLVASFVALFCLMSKANAAISSSDLNRKALLLGLKTCVTTRYMNEQVSVESFNTSGINAVFNSKGNNDGSVNVLAGVGNTLKDSDVSCEQVFTGYSGVGGSITGLGLGSSLQDYGYTIENESVGNGSTCVSVNYQYGGNSSRGSTNQICFSVDEKGKVQPSSSTDKNNGTGPIRLEFNGKDFFLWGENDEYISSLESVSFKTPEDLKNSLNALTTQITSTNCGESIGRCESFSLQSTSEDSPLKKQVGVLKNNNGKTPAEIALSKFSGGTYTDFGQAAFTNEDKKALYMEYYNQGIKSGSLSIDQESCMSNRASAQRKWTYVIFTENKWCKVNGVTDYKGKFAIISNDGQSVSKISTSFADVMHELMLDHIAGAGEIDADEQEEGKEICKQRAQDRIKELQAEANRTSDANKRAPLEAAIRQINQMISSNGYWTMGSNGSIRCTDLPNGSGGNTAGETTYNPGSNTVNNDGTIDSALDNSDNSDGSAGMFDGCFQESGVLGWILCPVLRIGSEALNGVYSLVIENFLQIDPNTVGDLRSNWDKFRNYANIIFAAAFIVVILSQITGIGISNYNIKKMLPRLIVIVVVVNASFFLCQAAVDLSNILGYGFNQFFRNLEVGSISSDDINIATFIKTTVEGIGATALTIAGINVAVTTAGGWFPLLLPLLLALVSALIGVFFFFVILCVRQAAIIILIVLAPVAIVCYALPNTKKAFDKWLKLFGDMLLVYPICGLLMGGSNYASRLLLSANQSAGLMFYIIAMLLPIISFFFIPAILRGSVNGIGQLGNKIQGLGRGAGRLAGGALRHSNWARTGMEEAQRNAMYRTHERQAIRTQRALERGGLNERREATLRRRLARSNAVLRSMREEDERNSYGDQHAYVDGYGNSQYERDADRIDKEQFDRETDNYVTTLSNDNSVDINDIGSLSQAHANALQEVYANPEDRNAQIRAAALEKAMIKLKSDEGATNAYDNYARLLQQGLAPGGAGGADVTNRIGRSAKRFMESHSGAVKQAIGKSAVTTMNDISSGVNYGNYNANTIRSYTDTDGNRHYYNSDRIGGDVSKITGRDFENLSDATFDSISTALDRGDVKDPEHIQRIMDAVEEFRTNPNINKKNSALVDGIARKAIAAGALSRSAVQASANQGANVSTAGSSALNNMSTASLRSIASQITNGQLKDVDAARVVSNLELAAHDDRVSHSEDWVSAANEVMAAANKKGIHQLTTDSNGNVVENMSSTVADKVDAANIRVDQSRAPVNIDPELTTATTADVRAAVEHAQAQFKASSPQYNNLAVATAADVQAALIQSQDPTMTVDKLGFKAGDIIRKVPAAGGASFTYSTVNQNLAESYRTGLKDAAKSVGISAGSVIRVTTDPNSGNKTYAAVSDAEAADYRAALEHNAYIKLHNGGSGTNP